MDVIKTGQKKIKKSAAELVQIFWSASPDAFFNQETIASVLGKSAKTLECHRWLKKGIAYRKINCRILYRKSDVVSWLEEHEKVSFARDNKEETKL